MVCTETGSETDSDLGLLPLSLDPGDMVPVSSWKSDRNTCFLFTTLEKFIKINFQVVARKFSVHHSDLFGFPILAYPIKGPFEQVNFINNFKKSYQLIDLYFSISSLF